MNRPMTHPTNCPMSHHSNRSNRRYRWGHSTMTMTPLSVAQCCWSWAYIHQHWLCRVQPTHLIHSPIAVWHEDKRQHSYQHVQCREMTESYQSILRKTHTETIFFMQLGVLQPGVIFEKDFWKHVWRLRLAYKIKENGDVKDLVWSPDDCDKSYTQSFLAFCLVIISCKKHYLMKGLTEVSFEVQSCKLFIIGTFCKTKSAIKLLKCTGPGMRCE